ncbi:cytidylyltransferase domain-containing protein [Clostridium magnum]|uniref:3-deoxy-manno-octulosonate cytidylyltransferase n=1 Tax=Clostridium magnum DSM 2767 TaxID=1121326 RepID=A0A162UMU2_9CLOT|nr:glycosyltransferase family protein [Clostridium magnum]KZL94091.1 3-deoxy-manno-octulosonate cytidylyltransferase [Clostridium magnum DSM 2767]SHH95163.1 spore coat polysaccharide biosynthesis protein SpsF [Clostridium magnum DSM 2767]
MIYAIIQARLGSSRLPGKVMMEIQGKPVLGHVYNRISYSKLIDKIIVATSDLDEDRKIIDFCKLNNIDFFAHSENDVLTRYYETAKNKGISPGDHVVRITADCPLHDANVVDKVIKVFLDGDYDYVSNTFEYTYPDGLDVEIFSFNVLEEAWKNARLASEREHVTPYMKKNDKYKKTNVISDKKYPIYRLTLDYKEDYELIKNIYEGIGKAYFSLDETIKFLEKHIDYTRINENYDINEGYRKSLKEDRIVK